MPPNGGQGPVGNRNQPKAPCSGTLEEITGLRLTRHMWQTDMSIWYIASTYRNKEIHRGTPSQLIPINRPWPSLIQPLLVVIFEHHHSLCISVRQLSIQMWTSISLFRCTGIKGKIMSSSHEMRWNWFRTASFRSTVGSLWLETLKKLWCYL